MAIKSRTCHGWTEEDYRGRTMSNENIDRPAKSAPGAHLCVR